MYVHETYCRIRHFKIVSKFSVNKSAGHDNIGNFIIKKVQSEIVKPLTSIFNLYLSTGSVPEKLKIAKVIPIYKKSNVDVFSNYRPVSLLPCFSKILERLVFDRCTDYIDINGFLNPRPTKGGGYHPPDGLSPAAQKRKRK